MEDSDLMLTSAQLAAAVGVSPKTVSKWRRRRGERALKAALPLGSRRIGLRITVADARAFVATLKPEDRVYTEKRLEAWIAKHKEELE